MLDCCQFMERAEDISKHRYLPMLSGYPKFWRERSDLSRTNRRSLKKKYQQGHNQSYKRLTLY